MSEGIIKNQCCLCGKEGKVLGEGICACDACITEAVGETYYRRNEKAWYKTKFKHWGFYLLAAAFLLYLITWFIIKPMLEAGG